MLKMPETIVCGDIGLVLLSGLGSRRTHPVGAEGATMARRAPFPLSSIPAYIDQSMKLIVCTRISDVRISVLVLESIVENVAMIVDTRDNLRQ